MRRDLVDFLDEPFPVFLGHSRSVPVLVHPSILTAPGIAAGLEVEGLLPVGE
jgi:hypothetical protein